MFYEQLVKLCSEKNIAPTALVVNVLGMSKGNLGKWREGVTPNGKTLSRIANYFGVTSDYLLGYKKSSGEPEDHLIELIKSLSPDERQAFEVFASEPPEVRKQIVSLLLSRRIMP